MEYEELVQLVQELQNRVNTLEQERDSLKQANNIASEIFEATESVTDSDVERTITINHTDGASTEDIKVLDYPDFWIPINDRGRRLRAPVYDI